MIHSTRRFILSLALCYFVRVCVFSPFSIAITLLGEERANHSAFRTFVRFALVWFCLFPLLFVSWCLGRAAACDRGTSWTLLLLFFDLHVIIEICFDSK